MRRDRDRVNANYAFSVTWVCAVGAVLPTPWWPQGDDIVGYVTHAMTTAGHA